jgi:hypothetical protein
MSEKIYLTYTNATSIPYQGSTLGHHIVLNYIDADGNHHTLQGVPENKFEHTLKKRERLSRRKYCRTVLTIQTLLSDGSKPIARKLIAISR